MEEFMRRFVTITLLALALACRREMPVNPTDTPTSSAATQTTASTSTTATTATTSTAAPSDRPPIVLSPAIPGDVTEASIPPNSDRNQKLLLAQGDFDIYSWNTFIALNWPPGPNGIGDPNKKIGQNGDNDTVWEHYRDVADVFLAGGAVPTWKGQDSLPPPECKADYTPGMRVVSQVGKTPNVLTVSENLQPFKTGPLIDQNGVFTRFEILVNKPMFDYILSNTLYSKAGQQVFSGAVKFPCGVLNGAEGAIMVKSAWKIIEAADKARFHSAQVLVYTPASDNPKYPASCKKQTVGLVGLHIGHKTNNGPQWLWSTFEHIDNAPSEDEVASGKLKPAYNYYNPKCPPATCKANAIPPRPWVPNQVAAFHTQVVRMNMFKGGSEFAFTSAAERNADALKLLVGVNPNSVWKNYELISTMWPTSPGDGKCNATATLPLGNPAPAFLANTTLETYVQGPPLAPNVSSNCIECHLNATMTVGSKPSDFTYVLQRAK
jgi:hypothetical protein